MFIDVLYSVFNLVNSTKDTTSPFRLFRRVISRFSSLVVRAIPPSFDPSPTPMMELDDPSEEDTESFTPTPAVHSSVMQIPVSVSQDDPAVRTTEEESVHHPTPSTQPEKAPVANNPKTSLFESKLKGSSSEVTVRNVENKLQRKWTVIGVKPNRGNVVERKRWSIAEVKPNPDASNQTDPHVLLRCAGDAPEAKAFLHAGCCQAPFYDDNDQAENRDVQHLVKTRLRVALREASQGREGEAFHEELSLLRPSCLV